MNTIYLILPVASDRNVANPELSFLKVLNPKSSDDVTQYLCAIYQAFSYVDYESFQTFYNQNRLNELIDEAKRLAPNRKYPEVIKVLKLFDKKPFTAYSKEENISALNINGTEIADGIIHRYLCAKGQHVLVDADALVCDLRSMQVMDKDGRSQQLSVIVCNALELYNWFVDNRDPQRILDVNYKKHANAPRNGYRGVISPLTYSKQEAEHFLKKAVGAESAKNLFFKDAQNNKIIVFWNENLQHVPTYHAYEITANDEKEIDKIYRKGGRSLVDKLNKHAKK